MASSSLWRAFFGSVPKLVLDGWLQLAARKGSHLAKMPVYSAPVRSLGSLGLAWVFGPTPNLGTFVWLIPPLFGGLSS